MLVYESLLPGRSRFEEVSGKIAAREPDFTSRFEQLSLGFDSSVEISYKQA